MARLTGRHLETLHEGLRRLYAHHDLDTLPRTALRVAMTLVPCDMAGYNEINPQRGRAIVIVEPAERQHDALAALAGFEKHMHQHPVLAHVLAQPNSGPKKISDFLTMPQFQKLDLFNQVFRPLRLRYQIVAPMQTSLPLAVGISMNREATDFSEADRQRLALLQPHLLQAYENAAVISDLKGQVGRYEHLLDSLRRGVMVIDHAGTIQQASMTAYGFLEAYLPDDRPGARRLPATLAAWVKEQIARMTGAADNGHAPRPLVIDGPTGRLVARVAADIEPGRYLLVLHEAGRPTSHQPLEGLGLSSREAQVLYWVVEGRTNPQIAALLHISPRTVHKHLEHVYEKIGVASRAEAITRALEWLRL